MAASTNHDEEIIAGINVTPLVDVVLVLLVVLMVTASYVTSRALAIEPPEAAHASSAPARALEIVIDARGRWSVDGVPCDEGGLRAIAAGRVAADPEATATVAADRTTDHGEVVGVLDVLRGVALRHVALRVRRAPP